MKGKEREPRLSLMSSPEKELSIPNEVDGQLGLRMKEEKISII